MNKSMLATLALASLSPLCAPALAAINVAAPSFVYSQNFDSLTTSTVAVPWANDSSLPGWYLFTSTLADAATIGADTGSSNAGTFRSYGASGNSERALGGTASGGAYFGAPIAGAVAGWMAVSFINTSGAPLDGFTLAFSGEQWRNGGNASAQSMVLEYGFGASFGSVANWVAPGGSFNWTSPVVGTAAGAVDGNAAGFIGGLGGSINTAWAPNGTLWIRWVERNDVGNDHGLAIDDLSFSVAAVPEPGALALMLAGLAAVGFVARRRA